jgi:hypothetical protein
MSPKVDASEAAAIRGVRSNRLGVNSADSLSPTPAWSAEAQHALAVLAGTGHPFTVDTLTQLAGYPPRTQMLGAAFATAAQRNLIEVVGAVLSEGRPCRLWRGCAT